MKAPTLDTFRLNGVALSPDEPYPFLDQANAVAALLAQNPRHPDGPLNPEIAEAGAKAIETLTWLAAFGLAAMDHRDEQRRSFRS